MLWASNWNLEVAKKTSLEHCHIECLSPSWIDSNVIDSNCLRTVSLVRLCGIHRSEIKFTANNQATILWSVLLKLLPQVVIVPRDALSPPGARSSTNTVLATKLDVFPSHFISPLFISNKISVIKFQFSKRPMRSCEILWATLWGWNVKET